MIIRIQTLLILTLASSALFISHATAQTHYQLKPFLMLGEMKGDLETSGIESDFNLGWGNALTKGNGALGIDFEIKSDDLGLLSQLWYTALSDTEPSVTGKVYNQAQQDIEGVFLTETVEVNVYQESADYFDLTFGGRFSSVTNDLTLRQDSGESNFNQGKVWIDPVVGINGYLLLDEDLAFQFGGDYGGFGMVSNSTWQAHTAIDFIINTKSSFSLGYRAMGYDYEKSDFKYEMVMRGPTVGFSFRF